MVSMCGTEALNGDGEGARSRSMMSILARDLRRCLTLPLLLLGLPRSESSTDEVVFSRRSISSFSLSAFMLSPGVCGSIFLLSSLMKLDMELRFLWRFVGAVALGQGLTSRLESWVGSIRKEGIVCEIWMRRSGPLFRCLAAKSTVSMDRTETSGDAKELPSGDLRF